MPLNDYNPADAGKLFNEKPPRILRPISDAQRNAAFERLDNLKEKTRQELAPLPEKFEN